MIFIKKFVRAVIARMEVFVRISCIKYSKDNNSFSFFKAIGANIIELEDLENTDKELEKLIENNYKTIFISNDVASFSEDIIKKYNKNNDIRIIITPIQNS